jgi:hypothetical protein
MSVSLRKPDFSKPVFRLFPSAADDIKAGKCPLCAKKLEPFRNSPYLECANPARTKCLAQINSSPI